ncbi:MAG: HAD family phosphatase [Endozoicomonadaceae bacterium]|nr:HAD family phosphatase [Endozoicomonadaceae bacterium]
MGHRTMTVMPTAILLDLDGTLIDTELFYRRIWQSTADEFAIDLSDTLYRKFIGIRLNECFQLITDLGGAGFSLSRFKERLRQQEDSGWQAGIDCKLGSNELLQFLHNRKIPMALVTSAGQAKISQVMNQYHWSAYFRFTISGEDIEQPKPAPESYLKAAKKLGLPPDECLALEDSNIGMRSALGAGCRAIMIPDLDEPDASVQKHTEQRFPDLFSVITYLSS